MALATLSSAGISALKLGLELTAAENFGFGAFGPISPKNTQAID
jgi:hypothetical protein